MATQMSFPRLVVRAGKSGGMLVRGMEGVTGKVEHTEKFHEDVVIDDFDADVAVKGGSDETTC